MRITKVEASCHKIPVTPPRLKSRNIGAVVVRIETDEGITGFGMTGWFQAYASRELINRHLAPFLVGKNPEEIEGLWSGMYETFNAKAVTGVFYYGLSAIDIALWDLQGKRLQQPVFKLLGGFSKEVLTYVTFGFLEYSKQDLAEVALELVKQGHHRLKMLVGIDKGQNIREDAARVRAVREAVGDEVELAIDANFLFDLPNALRLTNLIQSCDIAWFEDPVLFGDIGLMAELRRRTTIPIAAGTHLGLNWLYGELVRKGAVDIIQPNVVNVGGYTEAVKIAHMAQVHNIPISNGGGWPHHNAILHAAVPNGGLVELHGLMWRASEAMFLNLPQPKGGSMALSERPGIGFEPNEEYLRKNMDPM